MENTDLNVLSRQVDSQETLAHFVSKLHANYVSNPKDWENDNLDSFLEAMSAWVESMDGFYKNMGESFTGVPSWSTIAQILLAAKVYE